MKQYMKYKRDVMRAGFKYCDALYIGDIYHSNCTIFDPDFKDKCPNGDNKECQCMEYSHNPEWMVSKSIDFMNKAIKERNQPFFLYFSPTLTHTNGKIVDSMFTIPSKRNKTNDMYTSMTPIGRRRFKNRMKPRRKLIRILEKTYNITVDNVYRLPPKLQRNLGLLWLDDSINALLDYLDDEDIMDETMIVMMNDHGQGGKGTFKEDGIRVFDFIKFPELYAELNETKGKIMDNIQVSIVDIAPTIYDLIGLNNVSDSDGISIIDDILRNNMTQDKCVFVENEKTRAVIYKKWKYIWNFADKSMLFVRSD